ncbi:hypothetical protein EJ08DRAFT_667257 [Tothia fuscella]|uniref:Amine oxidase domain-containing protein n=1 Tax=Tothia fuscella TaxID=1048955 RepID=A0A9P4U507_9PEZI|nr:hypothetical protein EJ08DRAFT_667257 [Tothia fuscella]
MNLTRLSMHVEFKGPIVVEAGGMQNIRVEKYSINGHLSIHYGDCELEDAKHAHHDIGSTHVGKHHLAKRHDDWNNNRPTRFVWLPPQDIMSGGCLHAVANGALVGTSAPVKVVRRKLRKRKSFGDVADPEGPWFDGVKYLQQKQPDSVFVAQVKSKSIGIIGAGMAGLMTAYLLDSVGMKNWRILEASQRTGGRVRTSYLNRTKPEDYQYQEMGPMRFPTHIKYVGANETLEIQDHKMVFQLADSLNAMNKNNKSLSVDFIPFIESSPNQPANTPFRRVDGTVPGEAEVAMNPALAHNLSATYSNPKEVVQGTAEYIKWLGLDKGRMKDMATNIFKAHKQAIKDGLFDYSEAMYLREVLHKDLNITDQIASTGDYTPAWPYEWVYFSATTWKTIDKGLSRLPAAFAPFIRNKIRYGTPITELKFNQDTQKITAFWRNRSSDPFTSSKPSSQEFDYAVVAAPFSKVRLWRLPPYSSLLTRAINTLNYVQACKVALHYRTRFWEHLPKPIFGGCGTSNIPGIHSICYPSYQLNRTGPGAVLGSYVSGVAARSWGALSPAEHAGRVHRAMIETHGDVARTQFTGQYDRVCWENEENAAGAWCNPVVGQEELYLPAYYQTEFNTVFVGEHTSFTHAWIFSALESAVRGTTQLLLDMGLVDEAKEVTNVWMARWMSM